MKFIFIPFISFFLVACCTFSFTNVMTSGTASDVVDEEDSVKSDPDISSTLTIPVKPL